MGPLGDGDGGRCTPGMPPAQHPRTPSHQCKASLSDSCHGASTVPHGNRQRPFPYLSRSQIPHTRYPLQSISANHHHHHGKRTLRWCQRLCAGQKPPNGSGVGSFGASHRQFRPGSRQAIDASLAGCEGHNANRRSPSRPQSECHKTGQNKNKRKQAG